MPAELRVADHGAMRGTQTARGSLDGATWGLLALLAAAGCECSDSITAVKGSIATDPTALDFGSVPLGAEKRLSLSIRNRGSFTLTITGFEAAAPFVAPTATGTIGTAAPRVVEVGSAVACRQDPRCTIERSDRNPRIVSNGHLAGFGGVIPCFLECIGDKGCPILGSICTDAEVS